MLTRKQRLKWRGAREVIDAHLITTLDRVMVAAHGSPNREVLEMVLNTVPEVVTAYGSVTAELAAEFYGLARATAGLDDLFVPKPGWNTNEQQIAGSLRWALQPINGTKYTDEDFALAVDRAHTSMTRLMRQVEGNTIVSNIRQDPGKPRYRRVPEAGACGWCMMLASRGYAYSKETVGGPHSRFHEKCTCTSEPEYPGEPVPEFVQRIEQAWKTTTEGLSGEQAEGAFFAHVFDGGLGDRPIPGRDSKGNYRKTVDGEDVPFSRSDIYVHLRNGGVWDKHVAAFEPGRRRGGHLYEHAKNYRKDAQDGHIDRPKTLFADGYGFAEFNRHVRKTLGNPTRIERGILDNSYTMYREFDGITIAVQVAPSGKKDLTDKPLKVTSAFPVAGDGWRVNSKGRLRRLPPTVPRKKVTR